MLIKPKKILTGLRVELMSGGETMQLFRGQKPPRTWLKVYATFKLLKTIESYDSSTDLIRIQSLLFAGEGNEDLTEMLPDIYVEWMDYEEEVSDYDIEFVSENSIRCSYVYEGIRQDSDYITISSAIPYPQFAQCSWSEVKAVCDLRAGGYINDSAWSQYITMGAEKTILFNQAGVSDAYTAVNNAEFEHTVGVAKLIGNEIDGKGRLTFQIKTNDSLYFYSVKNLPRRTISPNRHEKSTDSCEISLSRRYCYYLYSQMEAPFQNGLAKNYWVEHPIYKKTTNGGVTQRSMVTTAYSANPLNNQTLTADERQIYLSIVAAVNRYIKNIWNTEDYNYNKFDFSSTNLTSYLKATMVWDIIMSGGTNLTSRVVAVDNGNYHKYSALIARKQFMITTGYKATEGDGVPDSIPALILETLEKNDNGTYTATLKDTSTTSYISVTENAGSSSVSADLGPGFPGDLNDGYVSWYQVQETIAAGSKNFTFLKYFSDAGNIETVYRPIGVQHSWHPTYASRMQHIQGWLRWYTYELYCSPLHFPSLYEMNLMDSSANNKIDFLGVEGILALDCRKIYCDIAEEGFGYYYTSQNEQYYTNTDLIDKSGTTYIYKYPFWLRDVVNQDSEDISNYIYPRALIENTDSALPSPYKYMILDSDSQNTTNYACPICIFGAEFPSTEKDNSLTLADYTIVNGMSTASEEESDGADTTPAMVATVSTPGEWSITPEDNSLTSGDSETESE